MAERVSRGAVNQLTERTSRSIGEIVRANVLTRFNAILGALFVLVMVTGSFADGLFGIVLVVNSAIGIVQEYLAKRKLDRLALLNAPTTRVVRDGEVRVVPTTEVVQDDLIELRTGDEVPADGTLIASAGLELNEANLTGESDPVPHVEGDDIMSGHERRRRLRPLPREARSGPTPTSTGSPPTQGSSRAPARRSRSRSTPC